MARSYDVVIVGAGPAGLMAARVAGENGLAVALLERKGAVADIRRSCATMFAIEDGYYFGERMYFNEDTHRFIFPVTGFSLPYDGPYKNFYAWHLYTADAGHMIRIGNYEANRAQGPQGRLSVTYSKQHLLQSLLADAERAGVRVCTGANVVDLRTGSGTNRVITAEGQSFEGTFVIAADGINSRITRLLGLNRRRTFYGTLHGMSYYMTGLDLPFPEAINYPMLFHKTTQYPVMIWIEPSPYAEDEFWVYCGGPSHPAIDYQAELDRCIAESPFKKWFPKPVIRKRQAHVGNIWSPVPAVVSRNVLIAGDAGWTVEAECTGAMMSGLKAANAVTEAVRDGRLDDTGVQSYSAWWRRHFADSMDHTEFLRILTSAAVGEDAAAYLNKLVTETLPCSLNPYTLLESVNAAIMGNTGRIQKERPDIFRMLQQAGSLSLSEQMKRFTLSGFPNA